jgi:hypothetical protein
LTWPDVVQHLVSTYGAAGARDDVAEVVVPVRAAATAAPTLEVRRFELRGAPWIEIAGIVGSMRHVSQLELLGNNARSTIGVFSTRDGQLALRHSLPLSGLRVAELDETLRELAELLAWSRKRTLELGEPQGPGVR